MNNRQYITSNNKAGSDTVKLCTWNVNRLARWKKNHKDLISLLEDNYITCITDSWLTET